MENNASTPLSFAERMKQKALEQKSYGNELETGESQPSMKAASCPSCGAGRAQGDGLTHCAYCGYEFIGNTLTDGVYTHAKDNSKKT